MKSKNIFLTIVFWCEIIISARLLMFTIPVLINKYINAQFYVDQISDWNIWVLTLLGFFYFMTGLASALQFRHWKLFHYVGLVLAVILTGALLMKVVALSGVIGWVYFVPLCVAAGLTGMVTFMKEAGVGA